MKVHVLPGDAQVEDFRKTGIDGDIVVCREALVDGDVRAANLEEFWRVREQYLASAYPDVPADYRERVVTEFEKLTAVAPGDEVNLWFEYELFCHVNMWFCLWLLRENDVEVYRVEPAVQSAETIWNGFGDLTVDDLKECYDRRTKFTRADIELGADLWVAYQNRNYDRLRELSTAGSPRFPYLPEAVDAEIVKETRPREILDEMQRSGIEDFGELFAGFRAKAGVYGYGDSQVKRLLG